MFVKRQYKENRTLKEIRGEEICELRNELMRVRAEVRTKEECLLKIFNEKEEVLGKYESVRMGLEEEFNKIQETVEVKERVAGTLKKENEGRHSIIITPRTPR